MTPEQLNDFIFVILIIYCIIGGGMVIFSHLDNIIKWFKKEDEQ